MTRIYPLFVSLLGSAGLGVGLTYFVGIYLTFQPSFEDWAKFFVPRALPLMVIPYVLLVAHMGLRYSLGQWLLERGAIEQARRYSSRRMNRNLVRGKREALKNRLVMARVLIREGAYEKAWEMLSEARDLPRRGGLALEYGRWKMEAALRLDARERVEQTYKEISAFPSPVKERAAAMACMAELALREGDDEGYRQYIERALWTDTANARASLTRTLALVDHGSGEEEWRDAIAMIGLVEERSCNEIPGRQAEFEAYRALLYGRLGEQDQKRAALQRALESSSDQWSQEIVDTVVQSLES